MDNRNSRRRCVNFAWRDDDPAYQSERANDRTVFRKILRERRRGRKTAAIIRGLLRAEPWASRMTGKTAESWRRKFNAWRKKWDGVQGKKSPSDPCKH